MKKITLSFIAACVFLISPAQRSKAWLELGVKGGGGLSWIISKNLWDDKKTVSPLFSGCYSYGAKLAINLSESHQIAFEGAMGMRSQKYSFFIDKVTYEKSLTINISDLMLFYRHNGSSGGYVEVGGSYSRLSKGIERSASGSEADVTSHFTSYSSAVLGFGGNMIQSGSFTWVMGIRIGYSLSDALSSEGGAGQSLSYPFNQPGFTKEYPNYKATKPITFQVLSEFNFDLGYLSKSSCKRGRVSFITF